MIFLQLKEPKEVYNGNVCTVCPRNFIHAARPLRREVGTRYLRQQNHGLTGKKLEKSWGGRRPPQNHSGEGEKPFAPPLSSPLHPVHIFLL